MTILDRKLIRELSETKAQSVAIAAVIASGVAVFVMSLATLAFLRDTRDAYYDRYRLADVFAAVSRAPESVSSKLAIIPGVATVETRIAADVTIDVPGLAEPAVGRFQSIPDNGPSRLNAIYLRQGRLPNSQRDDEVLASEAFFQANNLSLDETIAVILNGRQQQLRIVGIALSPEHVFQMKPGSLLPDERRYGVFWMCRSRLASAFDMKGTFNDVSMSLLRGASEPEVIDRVDAVLASYGCIGAYGRRDQTSVAFLNSEIEQLQGMAVVAPAIFLSVAVFLLHAVLSRRIATQRSIIAMLKAFGFTDREVALHYLQYALLVAGIGSVVGAAAGTYLASGLTSMYSQFYRFPHFEFTPDYRVIVFGIAISMFAGGVGCIRILGRIMALTPAEAMRPVSPMQYRRSLIEKLGLTKVIPLTGRMIFRQIGRQPAAALLSTLGISAAVAILLMGNFSPDAIKYLLDFQFKQAQREDVQVVFTNPASPGADAELKHLPGVQVVEPFRAVGVRIRCKHRDRRVGMIGLGGSRDLYRLLDRDGQMVRLPPSGLVLSDALARLLDADAGDMVTVEILEGDRRSYELMVTGLAQEFTGLNAYMDLAALRTLLGEDQVISGAYLAVDSLHQTDLYAELQQTPRVASISVKAATIEQFEKTVSENLLKFQVFNVFFAAVIAIGVVYNTARISLDERSRELSTMRVIGFSETEVSLLLLGELAVLTLAAIPIGWAIGYAFCFAMSQGFQTEQFRIPFVLTLHSFASSALVTLVAAAVSGLLVRRRLSRLDLVEVLKSRS